MARLFLLAVGILYAGLSLWCSVAPARTSSIVGFELLGGSGQSEFLTVYGGLEMGMAVIFCMATLRQAHLWYGLLACVVLHGSLVVFRTIGFVMFDDFAGTTYRLAIGEWAIFLLGGLLLYRATPPRPQ